jgi:hypothetical protein
MQQPKADDARCQGVPSLSGDAEAVIAGPHPARPFSQLIVRPTTHRILPRPLPCPALRRAMCGSTPSQASSHRVASLSNPRSVSSSSGSPLGRPGLPPPLGESRAVGAIWVWPLASAPAVQMADAWPHDPTALPGRGRAATLAGGRETCGRCREPSWG